MLDLYSGNYIVIDDPLHVCIDVIRVDLVMILDVSLIRILSQTTMYNTLSIANSLLGVGVVFGDTSMHLYCTYGLATLTIIHQMESYLKYIGRDHLIQQVQFWLDIFYSI